MNFFTVRDLRTYPKAVWDNLSENGELIITNNGKPTALMLNIEDSNLDEIVAAVRQAQAMRAVNNIRGSALRGGLNDLSEDDIAKEISATRKRAGK